MDDVGLATNGSDTSVTYGAMKEDDRRVDSLDHFMKSTDEPLPQVALEMRIVAHDKVFRSCFIVACVNPPVVSAQQHPRIDRSLACSTTRRVQGWLG